MSNSLLIQLAAVNNLKEISVSIPLNKLTVITGVSGSGKSSLAFDTIYEEGRRRYLMFNGLEVEANQTCKSITGLSPTVALRQNTIRQTNTRSTVGTRSQINQALAFLFAKYGDNIENRKYGIEYYNRNTTKGMCLNCLGMGYMTKIDYDRFITPKSQKLCELLQGRILKKRIYRQQLESFCHYFNLTFETRLSELNSHQQDILIYGDDQAGFDGLELIFNDFTGNSMFSSGRKHMDIYNTYTKKCMCEYCNGFGLGRYALNSFIKGKHIGELQKMSLWDLENFLTGLKSEHEIILIDGIIEKIRLLIEVGLSYLTLDRSVSTLSGGEMQRLFLASYLITNLQSLIFVFDEPTIGLHETEKIKLFNVIYKLIDQGNTVIVVEHDKNFIERADYIIDLGPGAGINGGNVIYQGEYSGFMESESTTAKYLSGKKSINVNDFSRKINFHQCLELKNACTHNLKNINVKIPLGIMVGVAGVSGSGKSSLITDTLVPLLKKELCNKFIVEDDDSIEDNEFFEGELLVDKSLVSKCIVIDQKPIGRKKNSTPISYIGGLDRIRELLASQESALDKGYDAGMFSKNSKGKCSVCKGEGALFYNIGLGSELTIPCEECMGTGYIQEALEIRIQGKNVYDIMQMSFIEAASFFHFDKKMSKILTTMVEVGMGYIKLGQRATTLSGGEAQRIKLAKELSNRTKNGIFILDEPTTGLAFADIEKLLELLNQMVEQGNSLIIVEHDTSVLRNCDYIVELGPSGGEAGGNIIACGSPKEVADFPDSLLSMFLKM